MATPEFTPEQIEEMRKKALHAETDTKVGLQEHFDNLYRKPAAEPITSLETPAEGPVPLQKLDIPTEMNVEAAPPAPAPPAPPAPIALSPQPDLSAELDADDEAELTKDYPYLERGLGAELENKLYRQEVAPTPFYAYQIAEDRAKGFFGPMDRQLKALSKKAKALENSPAQINWSYLASWAGNEKLAERLSKDMPTKQQKEALAFELRAKIMEARTGLAESKRKFMDEQLTGKFYSGQTGKESTSLKGGNVDPNAPTKPGMGDFTREWGDFRDYAAKYISPIDEAASSVSASLQMLAQNNPVADTAFVAELLKGRKLSPISELEFEKAATASGAARAQIAEFISKLRSGLVDEKNRELYKQFLAIENERLKKERADTAALVMQQNEYKYPILGKERMQRLVFPQNYPDPGLKREQGRAAPASTTKKPLPTFEESLKKRGAKN